MAKKPSIPKGTRDFNPEEVAKRNYIVDTIKEQFELFGFQPIETPSFENSDTLMGKYGEEGDRLIFKILNSGDYWKKFNSLLAEVINKMLRYLKEELEPSYYNLSENYRKKNFNDFINKFKNLVKDNNTDYYLDSKIPEIIVDDIIYLFTKNFGENNNCFEQIFKKDTQDAYPIITSIIFSDFYYRMNSNYLSEYFSEKALRYDLTVPFARYVVQHQNEIEFPFKRYQIQPVWRADRPQKGRFREFYQCDADVVGSQSLWQDVEFVQLYDAVFTALKLNDVTIKINNRKILSGIAEVIGAQDKLVDFTVALDKLDKIGAEKVKEEMLSKGIPQSGIDKLQPLFGLSGSFESQMEQLETMLASSEVGTKGIEELEFINSAVNALKLQTSTLELDVTLARGLNYYTGAIFEVSAPKGVDMGSIGGGGRYDDLTGIFGLKDMSGVGISFGLDRIYLVLESLNLFPETVTNTVKALFVNFGETEALACMKAIKVLRSKNINVELYPDDAKMKKQLNYANKRNINYVVLVGENELQSNTFTLKDMRSGTQENISLDTLIKKLQ